jgi:DNA-binding transcriptional MocR family regulator
MDFLYLELADHLEQLIANNTLRIGDKLPSLRAICREHGVSQSTALQAYYHLERKSLIVSRPRSGYFVANSPCVFPSLPHPSRPRAVQRPIHIDDIVADVYDEIGTQQTNQNQESVFFSLGVPSEALLPIAKLNKMVVQAMRALPGNGTTYEPVAGNERLRRQVARLAFTMEATLSPNDIITTSGSLNAVAYAVMATTKPGDTIAVESPVYFGILQLLQSLGRRVLELPTHPISGIDLCAFEAACARRSISACILISNFSNPIGSLMPDDHKRQIVELAERYEIPVIEDDLYGDIYFGTQRPSSCKTYDTNGWVLWCGSVSKTLAPGYRVGWIAPGRYKDAILQLKRSQIISTPALTHEVIARFLETGRYENHLRKFRHILHANCLRYLRAISEYFPEETKVSRPSGGFVLWVELPKGVDTMSLYQRAKQQKISIAPGRMFTLQQQFQHCMRLSYGLLWDTRIDSALKRLGKLVSVAASQRSRG